ncbi:hypothetical protein [Streptomyces sioyaensis]|uniref:hypothetical protein n=1 Tax=Streptomyces sioyaensis TaxID=67364 RepID=UPI003D76186C
MPHHHLPTTCADRGAPARRRMGGVEAVVVIVILLLAAALHVTGMPPGEAMQLLVGAGLVAVGVVALSGAGPQAFRSALRVVPATASQT